MHKMRETFFFFLQKTAMLYFKATLSNPCILHEKSRFKVNRHYKKKVDILLLFLSIKHININLTYRNVQLIKFTILLVGTNVLRFVIF